MVLVLCLCVFSACEEETIPVVVSPKPSIIFLAQGNSDAYWNDMRMGAAKAAKELNVDLDWRFPLRENDLDSQLAVLNSIRLELTNGASLPADGLIISPYDPESIRNDMIFLDRLGVPIIIADVPVSYTGIVANITAKDFEAGQELGNALALKLEEKGRIIMIRNDEFCAKTSERERGFRVALSKFPDMILISSTLYAGNEEFIPELERILSSNVTVDAIFVPNEAVAVTIGKSLQNFPERNNVIIACGDAAIALYEEGVVDIIVISDPEQIGYLCVKTMARYLDGSLVPKKIDVGISIQIRDHKPEYQEGIPPGDLEE